MAIPGGAGTERRYTDYEFDSAGSPGPYAAFATAALGAPALAYSPAAERVVVRLTKAQRVRSFALAMRDLRVRWRPTASQLLRRPLESP